MFRSDSFKVVWKESLRCNTKIEQGNAALQVASHVQGPQIKRDPGNLLTRIQANYNFSMKVTT